MDQRVFTRRPTRPLNSGKEVLAQHTLTQALMSGRLKPGMRLYVRGLAEKLGVGQATMRSAIRSLSWLGLIEERPRSGTYLRAITADDVGDMIECRAALESMAAYLASSRISPRKRDELQKLGVETDRVDTNEKNWDRIIEADWHFHEQLIEASQNPRLIFLASSQGMLRLMFKSVFGAVQVWTQGTDPAVSHEQLALALVPENPVHASELMRRHICAHQEKIVEAWRQHYGESTED